MAIEKQVVQGGGDTAGDRLGGQSEACSSCEKESVHWRRRYHDFRDPDWPEDLYDAEQVPGPRTRSRLAVEP